jgi:hypothetical protein
MTTTLHPEYSATRVRQGEIILKRPWQIVIFMAGLFGSVALLLIALLLQI